MKVSVIIPTHNRKKELENAINSVLNQTLSPKEIIIVDDASVDNLEPLIKNLKELNTNIKIKYHKFEKSKGACAARNYGTTISEGNIFMFLDDDDIWEPSKIENQLDIFNSNKDIGLVYSGRKMILDTDRDRVFYKINSFKEGFLYPLILYSNVIGSTSSSAIRKSVFEKVEGFDENLPAMQDYDLWIRCCRITQIGNDNQYNVRYTVSSKSENQISGVGDNHIKALNYILKKYNNEINKLSFLEKRKLYSSRYGAVAKAVHRKSYLKSLYWTIKSIINYPTFSNTSLILPYPIYFKILKMVKSEKYNS